MVMRPSIGALIALVGLAGSFAAWAADAPPPPLTAEQIVERNVAARGGLEAWRRTRAMVWSGHLESTAAEVGAMRFVLTQARPNRTRFEVTTQGLPSLRIFDGQRGWKVKPSRSIKPDIEPFSLQEVRFAEEAEVIDGPLIDFAAHGSRVSLGGLEEEQGRKAWHIDVVRRSGAREAVWIDAETFLDLRYDRTSRRPSGEEVKVSVYYHDFKNHNGVQIPTVVEFGGTGTTPANRMVIEEVSLNPELAAEAFRPQGSGFRRASGAGGERQDMPGRPDERGVPHPASAAGPMPAPQP